MDDNGNENEKATQAQQDTSLGDGKLHYDLKWGDMTPEKTTLDGKVYLVMEKRVSKGRDGAVVGTHLHRDFTPKMFASEQENCMVETYRRLYRPRRPQLKLGRNTPLRHLVQKSKTWRQ